jgi:hypothetical protein
MFADHTFDQEVGIGWERERKEKISSISDPLSLTLGPYDAFLDSYLEETFVS